MNSKILGAGLAGLGLIGYAALTSPTSAPFETYTPPVEAAGVKPAVTAGAVKKTAPAPTPKPAQNCNSNYSGCLLPDASDYDCAGGSGNGPYYTGAVQVLGYDEYGLDRDGDGLGCE